MKYNQKRIDEEMERMGCNRMGDNIPPIYNIEGVEATLIITKLKGENSFGFYVECGELSVLERISYVSNELNKMI